MKRVSERMPEGEEENEMVKWRRKRIPKLSK
jgi:hypothetical protein